MGFAVNLAFFAIGAILAFAIKWDVPGIDLQLIGWIFMGVGVAGGLITRMYTGTPREVREEMAQAAAFPPETPTAPHAHVTRSAEPYGGARGPHADQVRHRRTDAAHRPRSDEGPR